MREVPTLTSSKTGTHLRKSITLYPPYPIERYTFERNRLTLSLAWVYLSPLANLRTRPETIYENITGWAIVLPVVVDASG